MRMLKLAMMALALPVTSVTIFAQQPVADSMVVKTIPLHHMSNNDALAFLTPYVFGHGNVFFAGAGIHGVTVRAPAKTIADVERLLAQYDRSPATITLNFQLVSADYTNQRDPQVAGLDSVLRSVLKFSGYHVLATTVLNVSEHEAAAQTINGGGQDYRLTCEITDISGDGNDASVTLRVQLRRSSGVVSGNGPIGDVEVLSTGVTIPVNHTVVLGTSVEPARAQMPAGFNPPRGSAPDRPSAAQSTAGSDRALILVVRPQIANSKKD